MAKLKNTAEYTEATGIPKRKDTKRWCRGHTGVSHKWGEPYVLFPGIPHSNLKEQRCSECGRKRLFS